MFFSSVHLPVLPSPLLGFSSFLLILLLSCSTISIMINNKSPVHFCEASVPLLTTGRGKCLTLCSSVPWEQYHRILPQGLAIESITGCRLCAVWTILEDALDLFISRQNTCINSSTISSTFEVLVLLASLKIQHIHPFMQLMVVESKYVSAMELDFGTQRWTVTA